MQASRQLYVTPRGSNDDWYWLYGVVQRGKAGMLVSNDQMRDHIFELMRPRFFLKWRAHHQYKFDISPNFEAELLAPQRYTTCVQWLPEANAWMFPESASRWLCVKPKLE
jgi:proteinaceous RNase P